MESRNLLDEGRSSLKGQAQDQTERLNGVLGELNGNLQALLDGRPDEAGMVGDYARRVSSQVRRYSDGIDQRGFDGLLDDVQRFARRRPGAFLVAAAAAGFLAGRLGRGVRDAAGSEQGSDAATFPAGSEGTEIDQAVTPVTSAYPERLDEVPSALGDDPTLPPITRGVSGERF